MGQVFLPTVQCQVTSIPYQYGYLLQAPITWTSLASSWAAESGTGIAGRYHPELGEVHSVANLKRQDAYIQGTAGRTGTAFDVSVGTWKDDLYSAPYRAYNLSKPSGAYETSESSVVQHSSTSDISFAEVIIRRGFPPIVASPGTDLTHSPTTCYAYLHLAYGSPDLQDVRVAMEYNQPIRIDVTYDGGTTWTPVAIARDLGNVEKYLASNGSEIRLTIKPSPDFKTLGIEIGNGNWLVWQPDPNLLKVTKNITSFANSDHLLPRNGKVRLAVLNGSISMGYYPIRHDDITVTKSPRDMGRPIANAGNAFVVSNGLATTDANQTSSATINTDGQTFSYQLTTSMPDAGDGQGSVAPAILSDAALVIPAVWTQTFPDLPDDGSTIFNLPVVRVVEESVIDDVHRCGYAKATITFDNHFGNLIGSYSNAAVYLAASVDGGGSFYPRITGLTDDRSGGIKLTRNDPQRLVDVPVVDKTRLLDVPLGDEVCFDGWALCSVVRYLCEVGNIHPSFLSPNIPLYIPPGATADAPYGPAGYDCPYYILGKGSGLQPRYRFYPNEIVFSILELLATMSGEIDPYTGRPVPYYFGFDAQGIFHFEPVEFSQKPITMSYSTNDPTGLGSIEAIEVYNSVADMRTDITFQSIDANTFELLNAYINMPDYVKAAKGFRSLWIERNVQYASEDFLNYISGIASYQASLPQQTVVFRAPFNPSVYTGDQIVVSDDYTLGGSILASIKSIKSVYQVNFNGLVDSYSIITARASVNTI